MQPQALAGIRVVDIIGTISTSYCAKLCADYGADVINLEPDEGFATRRLDDFLTDAVRPEKSAMHAYLNTNKKSVQISRVDAQALIASADLLLDDGSDDESAAACMAVRSSICWYGKSGPYADFVGSDAQCFALNGMLRGIGPVEGPPLIPTGYQAQVVGGLTAFIGSLTQVLAGELGNRTEPVHLETSIHESCLCFTDVGVVSSYNLGIEGYRMGLNRFPPTYPLGVFPCKDGWLGVTVLTPGQWHAFCELLDMNEFTEIALFETSVGRLEAVDILEPVIRERLLEHSAEDLFYRGQEATIPLARVPTMEELFEVDQFVERRAMSQATLADGSQLTVPSVPFRLYETPPHFGGKVAGLGEHTGEFA
jgi:crotonobetainyl-CoA:carnitine CoA-transferase CaiB-like acyl-CoA transferase